VIVYVALIMAFVALFFALAASFKSSDVFQMSLAKVEASAEASELIGKPVSTGFPMGSINVAGPRGSASLSYSISGPKGAGTVYVEATKDMGRWEIDRLVLEQEGTGRRIDLMPSNAVGGAEKTRL
jgi:hypothetical protein